MASIRTSLVLSLITMLVLSVSATRNLPNPIKPGHNLVARLEEASGGGLLDCWNALMEIKSCSNDIILYFLNGQANIGPDCCSAIGVITHSCWPAMLTSIGFTAEEGSILKGYCDASAKNSTSPCISPVAASPPPPAVVASVALSPN